MAQDPAAVRPLLRAAVVLIPLGVLVHVALTLVTTDRDLLASLSRASVLPFVLAGALSFVSWFTHAARLVLWTDFVGHPIRFWNAFRINAGAVLGSAVTPTAVGGGTIRWALVARAGVPAGKAASLLTVEAVEDALFFALAVAVALALGSAAVLGPLGVGIAGVLGGGPPLLVLLGVVLALALGTRLGWMLARRGVLGARVRRVTSRRAVRLRRALRTAWADARGVFGLIARRGKTRFALAFALTSLNWTARYSVGTVLIASLGGTVQPVLFWFLGWLTVAASSAVPTPGAAGGAEAAFALVHAPFVAPAILGLSTSLWRLTLFYLPTAAAAVVFPLLTRILRDRSP